MSEQDQLSRDESIAYFKGQFRQAVIVYRKELEAASGDCGANLAAYINPRVSEWAQRANDLGRKLKKIDPTFPASWAPYPECN